MTDAEQRTTHLSDRIADAILLLVDHGYAVYRVAAPAPKLKPIVPIPDPAPRATQRQNIQAKEAVTLADGRMNRAAAAEYLGLAPKTLAQYASQGNGPNYLKMGRAWYFLDDLDLWIAKSGKAKHT